MAESFTREFTLKGEQCVSGAQILKAAEELGSIDVEIKPKPNWGDSFDPNAV